jgi:hypothetical protein
VEEKVPGKSHIKPKQAAGHAASLLQVLALPAVQAALGDTALVQQLQRVVQEAQLGFHNPSGRNSNSSLAAACRAVTVLGSLLQLHSQHSSSKRRQMLQLQ